MNKNSNSYIIIYSAVLVVIVAFLLAFVFSALKSKQDKNVALDLEKQVLYSLNIRDLNDEAADAKYKEIVKEDKTEAGDMYYVCHINGKTKFVYPLKGMGLWGGISGFLAVDDDNNTVYGAYFNHEGETAGLGAEIKDSRAWQEKFQGKKIFSEGSTAIALGVKKSVTNPKSEVDAVTGATLTSNGVDAMLKDGLAKFIKK